MDSIKKKMQSLANETANATARAERWETECKRINVTADQYEEQVNSWSVWGTVNQLICMRSR